MLVEEMFSGIFIYYIFHGRRIVHFFFHPIDCVLQESIHDSVIRKFGFFDGKYPFCCQDVEKIHVTFWKDDFVCSYTIRISFKKGQV